jgi:hypothetical protein
MIEIIKKAGRPAITNTDIKKKSYTISLTPNQAKKLIKKYKTLTRAILTLLEAK